MSDIPEKLEDGRVYVVRTIEGERVHAKFCDGRFIPSFAYVYHNRNGDGCMRVITQWASAEPVLLRLSDNEFPFSNGTVHVFRTAETN